MKTVICEDVKAFEYPLMKIFRDDDGEFVVLFTSLKCGMVIYTSLDETVIPLGHYSSNWDLGGFKPFFGSISLNSD